MMQGIEVSLAGGRWSGSPVARLKTASAAPAQTDLWTSEARCYLPDMHCAEVPSPAIVVAILVSLCLYQRKKTCRIYVPVGKWVCILATQPVTYACPMLYDTTLQS